MDAVMKALDELIRHHEGVLTAMKKLRESLKTLATQ